MTIIILLILTGLLLLILEFFVFPGITIAGIGGFILIGSAIYMTYNTFGPTTGHILFSATIVLSVAAVILALRSKTWDRLMLKTQITENVESIVEENINIGDQGVTITRLNPMGRVRINEINVEARCPDSFVDPQVKIEVLKVFKTYVIVKPVN